MQSLILERMRPRPLYYTTHRRQAAAGEPVGDAFHGPAFGERRGPAIAVFGAFGSISAGLSIMGTSALMGGLMIAGGVMSGLGAITGNKTLSSLGMLAGLAGGVGQFMQQGGFDSFSQAYNANGLSGVAEQFTGAKDYSPGMNNSGYADIYGTGAQADASVRDLLIPKTDAQGILKGPMPTIGGEDQAFGVRDANGGGLPGELGTSPASEAVKPTATSSPVSLPSVPVSPSSNKTASTQNGLLDLWKSSGDFTKMAVINAGAGALKGMSEADTNDKLLALKQSQTEAGNKLTDAQTAALEKKNAGVQTVGLGSFGANRSAAFGKNDDGSYRSYAEYIADRTAAMQRLFGQPATA